MFSVWSLSWCPWCRNMVWELLVENCLNAHKMPPWCTLRALLETQTEKRGVCNQWWTLTHTVHEQESRFPSPRSTSTEEDYCRLLAKLVFCLINSIKGEFNQIREQKGQISHLRNSLALVGTLFLLKPSLLKIVMPCHGLPTEQCDDMLLLWSWRPPEPFV